MGLISRRNKYKNQDYYALKKHAQRQGELFTDSEFPASDSSLGSSQSASLGDVQWKRPHELCERPRLFVEGASSGDACQGRLGNCWFVSACSVLATVKPLWSKVIPDYEKQEFDQQNPANYAGIFFFRFWRFGSWQEVVIDDLLPTSNGQLVYVHSKSNDEFWSALLEKAYAKLSNSYAALDGGSLCDALVDFTSGVASTINVEDDGYRSDDVKKNELFNLLVREFDDHTLMCAAVVARSREEMELRTETGLVKGHAYGITAVKKVPLGSSSLVNFFTGRERIYMIRLRNPWGEKEWSGAFSDGSPEWSKVSKSEREKLGLTFDDDGEFWMTFDDFVSNFTAITLCQLINTALFSFSKTWNEDRRFGQWRPAGKGGSIDRAGGGTNTSTILNNPQFRFDVESEVEEVIIQLSQKDRRHLRTEGVSNLCIGFHIMKIESNRKYRVHRVHRLLQQVAVTPYAQYRAVFWRDSLPRGRYLLVPTTFEPAQAGHFMLRVFISSDPKLTELVADSPEHDATWSCLSRVLCCSCGSAQPSALLVINVVSAVNLPHSSSSPDSYVVVRCGGESVTSPVVKQSANPHWNFSCIFYRTPQQPVFFDVWDSCVLKDKFIGRATLAASSDATTDTQHMIEYTLQLYGRGRDDSATERTPGKLTVEAFASDDMAAL